MVEKYFDKAGSHTNIRSDLLNFYKRADNVVKFNLTLTRGTLFPTRRRNHRSHPRLSLPAQNSQTSHQGRHQIRLKCRHRRGISFSLPDDPQVHHCLPPLWRRQGRHLLQPKKILLLRNITTHQAVRPKTRQEKLNWRCSGRPRTRCWDR